MVYFNSDIHMIEKISTLIWYGTILVFMIVAAFIVSPYMGFAMVGTLLLLSLKDRFML